MNIPLSGPDITEVEIAAVTAVLRTPRLSLGEKLGEFEEHLARYVGCKHGVAVSSGTAALHLALLGIGIKAGDEVIVPSFAFIAVANAVRYVGAIPVFADIDRQTLNLAPASVVAAITPQTRAVIVVHTFGVPAAMAELLEIARHHDLRIIEDACEALGGEYDGRKLGSLGFVGVFGFYPNKQITTGEGGMLVTNNPEIAAYAKMLRNQGRGKTSDWYEHEEVGYNYRISEINCALGIVQLQRLPEILEMRAAVARMYAQELQGIPDIELPPMEIARGTISWFVYVVRLAKRFQDLGRDRIISELMAKDIGCGRYFAPIHRQPAYQNVPHRCMDLQVTEAIAGRTLALPFFNRITVEQLEQVGRALQAAIEKF